MSVTSLTGVVTGATRAVPGRPMLAGHAAESRACRDPGISDVTPNDGWKTHRRSPTQPGGLPRPS